MKKDSYRHFILIIALILAFAVLSACGEDSPAKDKATSAPTENAVEETPSAASEPTPTLAPTSEPTEEPTASLEPEPTENVTPTPIPEPVNEISVSEFIGLFEGTWTADDGEFLDLGESEGRSYVLFAVWNAGGDFPVGHISSVSSEKEDEYVIVMSVDEGAPEEYLIKKLSFDSFSFGKVGSESKVFVYYRDRQFPVTTLYVDPVYFVQEFSGFWTESIDKDEAIQFFINAGDPIITFGRWSSNYIEYGEVTNVSVESDSDTYYVEVRWFEIAELGSPEHMAKYTIIPDSSGNIAVYFEGFEHPFIYYYDEETHFEIPDITIAASMTEDEIMDYIGDYHGRQVAEWWKEYIVNDDEFFITYRDPVSGKKFKCMYTDDYIIAVVLFV